MQEEQQFHELSFYTLSHPDKDYFIHQHIVDAFTAQVAGPDTKKIAILFSLAGLYLMIEKNFTGRKVQLVHMELAKRKEDLPEITLPSSRGEITITDVLNAKPGKERDERIRKWCASVWQAYSHSRNDIIKFLADHNIVQDNP